MKSLKRAISLVVVFSLFCGFLQGFSINVFAISTPLNLTVAAFTAATGTADITWDAPSQGASKSVRVTYHSSTGELKTLTVNQNQNQLLNKVSVPDLQSDYVYDLRVEVFNAADAGGGKIGEGFIYFLPQMSFFTDRVKQDYDSVSGGGREIGTKPRLKLRWAVPKVWNGTDFVEVKDALKYMQDNINALYNSKKELSQFGYRINISTDASTLNSGSSQSSLLINQTSNGYIANVSGNDTVTANVYNDTDNGSLEFDIVGRKSQSDSVAPTVPEDVYVLPDGDILPGSVYYMNIKPVFRDSSKASVFAINVGAPENQQGSPLMGNVPYTYTPLRFQLTKDASNNIYVKVYKINQGSLDMPRLFYEVQSSDDPATPNWSVRKTMDDSYFISGTDSALTIITSTNPNNEVFYKIVVKSESQNDKLDSMPLPYKLMDDVSRPPVPKNVTITSRSPSTRQVLSGNTTIVQKTTDITIAWDKPANWEAIKANTDVSNDTIFHFTLNTYPINAQPGSDKVRLESEGDYYGTYDVKYRLVKYISSKEVTEDGNSLKYTLKGFDLFTGEYLTSVDDKNNPVFQSVYLDNPDVYPTFLLPNKIYYLQMYTSKALNKGSDDTSKISDKSITTSFTTLSSIERDAPLPKNFAVSKNESQVSVDPATGKKSPLSNLIELKFDKVTVDWNNFTPNADGKNFIYYDLYMSDKVALNSFVRVGSTDPKLSTEASFTGTDPQSTTIKALIKEFTLQGTRNRFGVKLRPNVTYYFMLKTRLSIENPRYDKESIFTSILAVTTVNGFVNPPDSLTIKPIAPIDFQIAKDDKGNLMLVGASVTFEWAKKESNVQYIINATSYKLGTDELPSAYKNDAVYSGFVSTFGGDITLDPGVNPLVNNFQYDTATKMFRFTIDKWLFPNKLYYFNIRSINKDNGNYSSWVSIPVTTSLIDSPYELQVINGAQIGAFWYDDNPNAKVDDFRVYVKGSNQSDYTMVEKINLSLVKDGNIFYTRISGLQPNSAYSVRVYKWGIEPEVVYEEVGIKTKDDRHEIELNWKGVSGYRFEFAIKTTDAKEYTTLTDYNLKEFVDKDGTISPYYSEKTVKTIGTGNKSYYSVIKTIPVTLTDGRIDNQPLKSNTKYAIKIRAVKVDSADGTISYSKYIGPVEVRTGFDQDEYDKDEADKKKMVTFLDRVKKLEEKLYWRVDLNNIATNKILLKGDKLVNAIQNTTSSPFVLDISDISKNETDILYIPVDVIRLLNTSNKSFTIKSAGSEFTLRPRTFNLEYIDEISQLEKKDQIKDVYIKFSASHNNKALSNLPDGNVPVSKVNTVTIRALGSTITDQDLEDAIHDKIYNSDKGLITQKSKILMNTGSKKMEQAEINAQLTSIMADLEKDLSRYISQVYEGAGGISTIIADMKDLNSFSEPLNTKLSYSDIRGTKAPFVNYLGTSTWDRIKANNIFIGNSLAFDVSKPGKYVVLNASDNFNDLPDGYWAKDNIALFSSRYDLKDVFGANISLYPDNQVSIKEAVLLYEKIMGKTSEDAGMDPKQKAKKLGLDNIFNTNNMVKDIQRQETSAYVMQLYSQKTGVDLNYLKPKKSIFINDESTIDSKYYKPVVMAIDLGFIALDGDGNFSPQGTVTRAQLITVLVRLLKNTGDLQGGN